MLLGVGAQFQSRSALSFYAPSFQKSDKAKSEELKKAENDLLNAVANILLAQAMPDLLKKGDMANIKGIFQELDTQKKAILMEYEKGTKPYYDNMLKDLAKNMAILQLKNILNGNMTKEELAAAERTRFGTMMVHEVKARMYGEDGKLLDRVLAFGYGLDDCQVYNYWDENYPVQASRPHSLYRLTRL